MSSKIEINFEDELFGKKIHLQTGKLANQTTSSVFAKMGETSLLVSVVIGKNTNFDYLPLQVIYEERYYAAGKMKNSQFNKREGRPSDKAVLTGRKIDRSLRPLFDPNIRTEIQVVITVLSIDNTNPPDILAILATSSALSILDLHTYPNVKNISEIPILVFDQNSKKYQLQKLSKELSNQIFSNIEDYQQVQNIIDNQINVQSPLIIQIADKGIIIVGNTNKNNCEDFLYSEEFLNKLEKDNEDSIDLIKSGIGYFVFQQQDVISDPNKYKFNINQIYRQTNRIFLGPVAGIEIANKALSKTNNLEVSDLKNKIEIGIKEIANLGSIKHLLEDLKSISQFSQTNLNLENFCDEVMLKLGKIKPQFAIQFKEILSQSEIHKESNQDFIINPTYQERENSNLHLVVSGIKDKVVMIEFDGDIVEDQTVKEALQFCKEPIKQILELQNRFINKVKESYIE
jgi:ribonuclease PH